MLVAGWAPAVWADPPKAPALMLANRYRPSVDLDAYWVSEKYDGVRGYWDGKRLITRGGLLITAPTWFTQNWPTHAMDGELWAGLGGFETSVSTARRQTPDDAAWRAMRFMVFDLPQHPGDFDQRIPAIQAAVRSIGQPWVQAVAQFKVRSHSALQVQLEATVRRGGEGLMLHRGDSLYQGLRSDDLLKFKLFEDADAQVVQHLPGKGKYQGQVGALLVQTPQGQRFRLGSGLSDALRASPPKIGTWISYRFQGSHDSGLPRFARFLRVREDQPLNEGTKAGVMQNR
ncbi:MAG: DNA ligase [Hydrogenophaga sp.]